MKLSCLFSVVMCFGVGAIMALPIDHECFETSNTDHQDEKISIHGIQQTSPMDDTLNTWTPEEDANAALHLKPTKYKPTRYFQNEKFGYKAAVKDNTDSLNAIFENVSSAYKVPEKKLPYAVNVPKKYYVEDIPDVVFENIPTITNASKTYLRYGIDVPLEYYVKETSDDVPENISIAINIPEANLPYAMDIPLEYDVEDNTYDVFEQISISNVSEPNSPYANIPQKYHVNAVLDNVSTNTNNSETTHPYLIDIPMEYHEHAEIAKPTEKGNLSKTTEFLVSENTSSAIDINPNESMVVNTEITVNCTNCTDNFEDTTEPKLIGCMCALFTKQHPTENDIPLTSRTFHNVSCEQDVHSADACNEVCIGVATINNELMDRMVCSFVPTYVHHVKAFLQSKLCEDDAEWNFTGISSPSPICCYMGTQITC